MMNNIISLSGKIYGSPGKGGGAQFCIVDKDFLSSDDAAKLKSDIINSVEVWKNKIEAICDPIVSIRHNRVIPKSKRVQGLFKVNGVDMNSLIVGSYYDRAHQSLKQVIVYRMEIEALYKAIERLDVVSSILDEYFDGKISKKQMSILFDRKTTLSKEEMSLRNTLISKIKTKKMGATSFGQFIQDISSISDVFINTSRRDFTEPGFITFYNIGLSDSDLLMKLNLPKTTDRIGTLADGYAFYLNPIQMKEISERYPYLIAMSLNDFATEAPVHCGEEIKGTYSFPEPTDEPVIGVIDSSFDEKVCFADWVDCRLRVEGSSNYLHGTAVCSLIVNGPAFNPDLEDGCGMFRVRHFAVLGRDGMVSQLQLYKNIDYIVRTNPDIKVWNISLGTEQPIEKNSISLVGALLDRLQAELDVIFVVAGTNNKYEDDKRPLIGAPADSVNSLVVNSVNKDGLIPDYARRGPVLEFFQGPNLCAVGGDSKSQIYAYSSNGKAKVHGTSFAACWVTRKVAYLIYRLHLSREVAKALLIDAAYGWNISSENYLVMGAGILPQHISEIIMTPNDEFKVIIRDTCLDYMTYGYNIPIPLLKGKFPFLAKATLCYFPWCSRQQGVDYTLTELDLHFGRMNGKSGIKSINHNRQGDGERIRLYEIDMKQFFGKWDSVKHITEGIKPRSTGKRVIGERIGGDSFAGWGFFLLKKKRFDSSMFQELSIPDKLPFGLVLTFKSIDKRNRADDFIRYARSQNWNVSIIDVDVMNEIYEEGQIEINFTE